MDDLTLGGEPCRPIPGYPDYAVSASGKVWSMKRRGWREKKSHADRAGYMFCQMQVPGGRKGMSVHRMVMLAWVGPLPDGHEVNHLNRDRGDNRLENLAYVNHAENQAYSKELGAWDAMPRGKDHHAAKLTEQDVTDIRLMYHKGGYSHQELADIFCISRINVYYIIMRRSWKHLPDPD
jgi:hypothetical protein